MAGIAQNSRPSSFAIVAPNADRRPPRSVCRITTAVLGPGTIAIGNHTAAKIPSEGSSAGSQQPCALVRYAPAKYARGVGAALGDELRWRAAIDKHVREHALEWVAAVDEDNTSWLRALVNDRGWPRRSRVGEEAATAAWLLAQHADRDPDFQRTCLALMEEAVRSGEASASNCAYLTDRVLRAEGRPQRFGTQFHVGPGGYEPQPLEDPDRVDERRASVGLEPLKAYRRQLARYSPTARGLRMPSQPPATCRSGPLEVRVHSHWLPGVSGLLLRLASFRLPGAGLLRRIVPLGRFRPRPDPVEQDVPLPWLPEDCVPCRLGPWLGATRDGRVVLSWHQAPQPVSEPFEVHWLMGRKRAPRLEAADVAGRPAVWAWGPGHLMLVVMTERGTRWAMTGTLPAADLLRVAATLPD